MRILITAGGTREYIDPVRFITNASSGRMGYALARAALKAGHKVTLITTVNRGLCIVNRATSHESRATIVKVETSAEMFDAVRRHFPRCDCLIMAAAVADYAPARPAKTKIKSKAESLTIKLKPTVDILKWAGKHKQVKSKKAKGQIVVGFALEDKDIQKRAEKKLKEKNLDMIIANTPDAIGSDESTVHIKTAESSWTKTQNATKTAIAKKIISMIENQL